MCPSPELDGRNGERARGGVATEEAGQNVGEALADKLLVVVQPLVRLRGQRARHGRRLHQADGRQGQCAGGQVAEQLQVEQRLADDGEFESRLDWLAKMAERESIEELPTLEWRDVYKRQLEDQDGGDDGRGDDEGRPDG